MKTKKLNINIISTKSNFTRSIEILAKDIANYLSDTKKFNINFIELKQYGKYNNKIAFILKGFDILILGLKHLINPSKYKGINIFPNDILNSVFFTMINRNKNIFIHHHFDYLPTDQLKKIILKQKYFVCDTLFGKEELLNFFKLNNAKIEPNNIKIIPLATQLEDSKFHKIKINTRDKYLLYIGSEIERKNIPTLIEIFASLKETHPNLKLIKCGPEKDSIIPSLATKKGLSKNDYTIFSDITKSDLSYLYENAACFVSCSRLEGFGMPVAEAMSVGCPVVISDISPFRELVGDNGMFGNLSNTENFVKNIDLILSNEKIKKDYVKYIQTRFNEILSIKGITKKRIDFLNKVNRDN